jgi:hypothetical protein
MRKPTRKLLAALLTLPAVRAGGPWYADEFVPLPALPAHPRAACRSGREGMLGALLPPGLLAQTPDGRYRLTALALHGGARDADSP